MKTGEALSLWLKLTVKACAHILRFGVLTCFIFALALFLFRPETGGDEASVFVLTPIAVFWIATRLVALTISYVPAPQGEPPKLDFRTKFILWSVVGCIFVALVGIPSLFIFRLLHMEWAADFAMRFMYVTLASVICSALGVGMRIASAIRMFLSVIKVIEPPGRDKLAVHC